MKKVNLLKLKEKSKKLNVFDQQEKKRKKSKKENFEKVPKVRKSTLIQEVNFQKHYFKTKWNEYFCVMFLGSFSVMASDDDVIQMKVNEHDSLFREVHDGLSFIDIYVSQDYQEHINFMKSKMSDSDVKTYVDEAIEEKMHQYQVLSKMTVQLSYCFIFGDTLDEMNKNREDFQKMMYVNSSLVTNPLEYAQIFFKLNNKNLEIDMITQDDLKINGVYNQEKFINTVSGLQKPLFDLKDVAYTRNDIGYEACFQVFQFKQKEVGIQWLKGITNLNDVIVIRSHSTQNLDASMTDLNNQDEENFEEMEKGRTASDRQNALRDSNHTKHILNGLQDGEVIVDTVIRIYTWADSIEEMDKKHSEINSSLLAYGQVASLDFYLNERDWIAPFQSLKRQKEYGKFAPVMKSIPSSTLGATLPYDYQMLLDKMGVLLGNSFTGQPVIFNQFMIDELRNSYHIAEIGNMGTGKSTLMKILEEHAIISGNHLYGFDFERERKLMVEKYDGLYPDGSQSTLNPLQIYITDTDENLASNFISHLSRLNGFFKYLFPDLTGTDLLIAQMILQQTYYMKDITPYTDFHEKENYEYPIFDDANYIYKTIRDDVDTMYEKLLEQKREKENQYNLLYDEIVQFKINKNIQSVSESDYIFILSLNDYEHYESCKMRLLILREEVGGLNQFLDNKNNLRNQDGFKKLDLLFKSLSSGGIYSTLFNQHTTFNPNDDNTTIIVDMSKLWNGDINVLQAVYYNWNNYFWQRIVPLKEQHDVKFQDIKRAVLSLDEAKILLDPKNTYALEQLSQYSSRGRKYFLGMIFGLQALRDIVPEATDSYFLDTIKRIFSQIQYTYMFKQSGSNLPLLEQVFPHLTQRQLNAIPKLRKGQTLLMINEESYFINVFASERQKFLFRGGL